MACLAFLCVLLPTTLCMTFCALRNSEKSGGRWSGMLSIRDTVWFTAGIRHGMIFVFFPSVCRGYKDGILSTLTIYYFILWWLLLQLLIISNTIIILGINNLLHILSVSFSNFYCHTAEEIMTYFVTTTLRPRLKRYFLFIILNHCLYICALWGWLMSL